MGKNKILIVILIILVRASDFLPRALMADEKPNPDKVSITVDKALNQNPQPKPVESPPNSDNLPVTTSRNDGKKDASMKDGKSIQNVKMDEGQNITNNEEKKGEKDNGKNESIKPSSQDKNAKRNDGTKESNSLPESQDDSKNDDIPNESNGLQKSQDNSKNNDTTNESNSPPKSQESGKQNNGPKESNGHPESDASKKKDDGKKSNEVPPKREENRKKNDETRERKVPNGDEIHMDKSQLQTCDASLQKCQDHDLVACLRHSEIDSKELALVVQNAGDDTLKVNIAVPPSIRLGDKMLNLAKHSTEKVNISSIGTQTLKIVLNAGKGDCVIQIGMETSLSDWLQQFPVYASQLTPIYAAYFLFVTLVIGGGIWVFCKFRKRGGRVENGVQYQQLEMGTQMQPTTEIVEASTVDGWEQGWDDDWDEEEVIDGPSTANPNGNVSSTGLTSRSTNKKNGWDMEWDD